MFELTQYKQTLKKALRPRTLTFLRRDDKVLLGLKKTGFGKGYLLGIGGKAEENESIEEAAKREVKEEIGVCIITLEKIGILDFYFPYVTDQSWNQQVHAFISRKWEGEPQESTEIKPEWISIHDIPYEKMWDDARYWLPYVLKNEQFHGEFFFDESNVKVIQHSFL